MGVQLGNLVESSVISIKDLAGKTIAFDGHNILYQFLAIIRGRQGEPLRDSQGRVTSHLSGLIYRNSNLMEAGIRVVYVFDGEPHLFKKKVLKSRKETRYKAQREYEKAIKEGDQEKARRFGQQAVIATRDIVSDAKTLLTYMGIPWIQAPGEGEAQTAFMSQRGEVWAAASQDYDSLLYGAPRHIRNLSITGRRKLPRKNVYIKIEPEIIELNRLLGQLKIDREQLIDMGILIGTDYNPDGVKGVGPKTALKLIQKHGSLTEALPHIKDADFPFPVEDIKKLFLSPRTTEDYELEWRSPDTASIIGFLCGEHDFSESRVLNAIEKMQAGFEKQQVKSSTLDRWFA